VLSLSRCCRRLGLEPELGFEAIVVLVSVKFRLPHVNSTRSSTSEDRVERGKYATQSIDGTDSIVAAPVVIGKASDPEPDRIK
jgi:hypothetical protein